MNASLVGTYRAMAYNNAWANYRLLTACKPLSQSEFEAPRTGFFPSLQATLNHILIIDWFYVDALEGGWLGPKAWANRIPCPTLAALMTEQRAVDERLIAVCNGLSESDLSTTVRVNRNTRVQTERRDRLLLHLFQHQIHHRGQAHAMLSGTAIKPPQLDEFYSVAEAPLRAGEFAALGWSEATIWTTAENRPENL
ncbi:MAG: DinB family protein [Parvibaculum sp.]